MSLLPECRLLLETEPNSGAWNMAVDEALLETAVAEERATFRWYRWSEPTLSLGYFQNLKEIEAEPRWAGLPKVRRLTGGGAILHHHEWTYSLVIPAKLAIVRRPEDLYDVVHEAIVDCLRRCGYPATIRGKTRSHSPEPFLCFSRSDSHDVVLAGHKILGSAQRRRKGAILQHGSLLVRSSPTTPEHLGLTDLVPSGSLDQATLAMVPQRLAQAVVSGSLSEKELESVTEKLTNSAL